MNLLTLLKATCISAVFLTFSGCGSLTSKDNEPSTISTAYLTDSVKRRLKDMDVVVVGENHDNEIHHEIQLEVIQHLHKEGRLGQVVFEHLSEKQASDFNQATGSGKAYLLDLLRWGESHWPDFEIFYPIFAFMQNNDIPAIAGHVDRQALMSLYSGESPNLIAKENRQKIPLDKPLPPEAEQALVERIRDSHCGMLNDEHAKAMLPLQRYRDGYMAAQYLANQNNTDKTTVFLLGNGHAREDYGVPYYLRGALTKLNIHIIQLKEDYSSDYEIISQKADGVFFEHVIATPTQEREDPCKNAAKMFKKHTTGSHR